MTDKDRKEYFRAYYQDHREHLLEYTHKYHLENRERINAYRNKKRIRKPPKNKYICTKGDEIKVFYSYRQISNYFGWSVGYIQSRLNTDKRVEGYLITRQAAE